MKNTISAVILAGLVASPVLVLADNCGNSARAQLPACVKVSTSGGMAVVQNTCSHTVDVKYDRRNGKTDSRRTVNPNQTISNEKVADYYWCCTVGNCDNN